MHVYEAVCNCLVPLFMIAFYVAGVNAGACGTSTIRLRPALIFTPDHAAIFLTHLEAVVKEFLPGRKV
jgi:4-aminobutyrate aminotransferase-like enzyme